MMMIHEPQLKKSRYRHSSAVSPWISALSLFFAGLLFVTAICATSSAETADRKVHRPAVSKTHVSKTTASTHSLTQVSKRDAESVLHVDGRAWEQRQQLLIGLEFSLHYLTGPTADADLARLQQYGVRRQHVLDSVKRMRDLWLTANSPEQLTTQLRREFDVYKSIGFDGQGAVRFTGYFQPVYLASRTRTERFRYPIFTRPADFSSWEKPHPLRWELEGRDGLGVTGQLAGRELAFLASRFETYNIHLQGSAILELPDGERMAVGFDGATDHRFVGFSKSWLAARKVSWTKLREFFAEKPHELDEYLMRNNRFIFFRENPHPLPVGSLGVPVIAEHSIATDKAQLIPGGISILRTRFPTLQEDGHYKLLSQTRFVLDQDTGSAIRGPGRADVFMGTGPQAQAAANKLYNTGELYYLLLKKVV